MAKEAKKAHRKCQSHQFSLKPLSKLSTSSRTINLNLSFCSTNTEATVDRQHVAKCLQAPVFNNDGSFASPSFTLPSDKDYYSVRRSKMMEQHELRFRTYTDQKSELNIPKPKSKNNYCSVCKQHYQDYLQHVQNPLHKRKVRSSAFAKHIKQLTQTFKKHRTLRSLGTYQKNSEKVIISETIQEDSDEVEIISNPNKQIKTEGFTAKAPNVNTSFKPKLQRVQQPYFPFEPWINQLSDPKAFSFNFNPTFAYNQRNRAQNLPINPPPPIGYQCLLERINLQQFAKFCPHKYSMNQIGGL